MENLNKSETCRSLDLKNVPAEIEIVFEGAKIVRFSWGVEIHVG